ncbi:MAG: hypothetical protein U0X40_05960 [Ferruginibacter sp.]
MKSPLLFIGVLSLLSSCRLFEKKEQPDLVEEKLHMIEADKAFSRLSEEKGIKTAFLEYLDSNGVLLRPNQFPLVGADAVDYLLRQNDSNFVLKWEPKNGSIAHSGDLGFTYGIYALYAADKDTTIYGNYVSIWKKQKDGSWKYILDSGNEGVGESE